MYVRRLAETRGNFAEAAEMEDYESKKPKLAKQIIAGVITIYTSLKQAVLCTTEHLYIFQHDITPSHPLHKCYLSPTPPFTNTALPLS